MRNTLCAVVLLMSVAFSVSAQAADGTLAAARDLYVSASYDDALAMLSGLSTASPTTEERQSIDLYRTLCLFALGRSNDADRIIEGMLMREPLYRPSSEELSPRVTSAFREILPFGSLVKVCRTQDDWVTAAIAALRQRPAAATVAQQRACARGNFWSAKAVAFLAVIDALAPDESCRKAG